MKQVDFFLYQKYLQIMHLVFLLFLDNNYPVIFPSGIFDTTFGKRHRVWHRNGPIKIVATQVKKLKLWEYFKDRKDQKFEIQLI